MYDLITATQCLKKLKDNDNIKYSKSYFSQMVSDGKIPTHSKLGSPKNFFKYKEVKQAIEDSKDPTRDAQREANIKRKEEPVTLLDKIGKYPSIADMSEEEISDELKAIKEAEDARREAIAAGVSDDKRDGYKPNIPSTITQASAKAEKEYWLGRKTRLDVEEKEGKLVPVNQVKAAFDFIISPVNTKLDELPHRMRSYFNDLSNSQYEWLIDSINSIKNDLTLSRDNFETD